MLSIFNHPHKETEEVKVMEKDILSIVSWIKFQHFSAETPNDFEITCLEIVSIQL